MRGLFLSVATLLALGALFACSAPGASDSATDDALKMTDLPVRMTQVRTAVFDQAIDHDAPASGTFKQRYHIDTEFSNGPDSPTLFLFCGESECKPYALYQMADTAKTLHASVVALEHRYYGQSLPYPDLTLEHMQYLTIHQALEDAAAFQRFAQTSLGLQGKWLGVGGSYSGMLSSFYRLKHPELVAGAWASSAPVNVQRSFYGGDAIAARALGPTCTLLLQQALSKAGEMFDDPSRRSEIVRAVYHRDYPTAQKVPILATLSSYAAWAVQRGNVRALCSALGQDAIHPLDGLLGYASPPLVPDDPADAGAPESDAGVPTPPPPPANDFPVVDLPPAPTFTFNGQQWFYQTCTEVGFFAVANPDRSQSIKPAEIDDAYYSRSCDAWVHRQPDIQKTRAEYYDPIVQGKATNIFFVNGSYDPWSALSFADPTAAPPGTSAFVVAQGTHCEDMQTLHAGSLLGVFQAHLKFHDLAVQWLAQ